jgi:hypothetical protein
MTICTKCHRPLTREPVIVGGEPFGPKCAAAIAKAQEDARQAQLFPRSLLSRGARLWDGFVRAAKTAIFGGESF